MVKVKVIHSDGWNADWSIGEVLDIEASSFTPKAVVKAYLTADNDGEAPDADDIADFLDADCGDVQTEFPGVISVTVEGDSYHFILMS